MSETPRTDESYAEFETWFLENYPPSCILTNPSWHAPKIYRAALRALRSERAGSVEWQPIETAPKDGTNVLLINHKGNMATGLWQGEGVYEGWWLRGGHGPNTFFNEHHGPSHWMPLPAPPPPREGGGK